MHFVNANGMNVYRGCTHGCIYCDSRSRCYHIDHDFEDIEVKQNAPQLLEDALRRRSSRCMIGTGAMCDPYMHCEEEVGLTRKCLQLIDRYGFGLAIQTKSDILPVGISFDNPIRFRSKVTVRFGKVIKFEELGAEKGLPSEMKLASKLIMGRIVSLVDVPALPAPAEKTEEKNA